MTIQANALIPKYQGIISGGKGKQANPLQQGGQTNPQSQAQKPAEKSIFSK